MQTIDRHEHLAQITSNELAILPDHTPLSPDHHPRIPPYPGFVSRARRRDPTVYDVDSDPIQPKFQFHFRLRKDLLLIANIRERLYLFVRIK
ncbi:hypothetical protein BofuT4_uP039560.1 [Botrytis cinerea T4]|uniref:Uncharacterized protein n=1 Tax=Botryotinia fuckeliana (strain T4) TaxID=999810 RepID=G2Y314_BOTF4|nr:hypothetical protein BofuT4_uP039560.1 [Botrytis cinerea T4]